MDNSTSTQPGSQPFRSGVAALLGATNAGKSTLLNRLLGQKIAIVTPKPQTTRNRILGVVTGEHHQILLLDTPGLHGARDLLNRELVRTALESLGEADVIVFLADASLPLTDRFLERQQRDLAHLHPLDLPTVLALNKIDLASKDRLDGWTEWFASSHRFDAIIPVSALHGEGCAALVREVAALLPEGPKYFPDDMPTDASERFICAEIIREKVFLLTREEVPYGTAVQIEEFREKKTKGGDMVEIHALILVEQKSQKGIILGKQGRMIKEIGIQARRDIESLLGCRVMLRLWVKVRKNWSKDERILRELGYST